MPLLTFPHTRSRILAAAAAALTACVGVLAPAQPLTSVFDAAPKDAEIVIAVPGLGALSKQIAGFASASGLDALAPEMSDALAAFKQEMGWTSGVDNDGPLLLVVDGLAESIRAELNQGPAAQPDVLILVPVADYGAFVEQLKGDPAAGVSPVVFVKGESGFAKNAGGYAVLGKTQESVEAYQAGGQGRATVLAFGEQVARRLNQAGVVVHIDVAALAPSLEQAVEVGMAELRQQMSGELAAVPGNFGAMINGFIDAYESAALTLLDGTDKYLATAALSGAGLSFDSAVKLRAGTELAGYFNPAARRGESAAPALLASLPADPYIYALAADTTRFDVDRLVDKATAVLGGDGAGPAAAWVESMTLMKHVDGLASVFYTPKPEAMATGGFFTSLNVYDVDNPAAFVAAQKAYLNKLADTKITLPVAQPGAEPMQMSFATEFVEKELVVEGADVHRFKVNTILPPEMLQQFGPMAAFMGNAGSGGYLAAKGGRVLVTTVADLPLLTRGLRAIDADNGVGSGGAVAELRQTRLPHRSLLEAYLSVGGIVQTVNPFLLLTPVGRPIDVPENLPPAAMGLAADGQTVEMRVWVPSQLVEFGLDTYHDCLLYTSPSPRDQRGSRMPSSA